MKYTFFFTTRDERYVIFRAALLYNCAVVHCTNSFMNELTTYLKDLIA